MEKPSSDTLGFEFHSAGGVAELPRGSTETKVIDQRAPERKNMQTVHQTHKNKARCGWQKITFKDVILNKSRKRK